MMNFRFAFAKGLHLCLGFSLIFLFITAITVTSAYAQSEIARSSSELDSLQKKIALVKRNIAKQQKDKSSIQLELKKIEQQISNLQKKKLSEQQTLAKLKDESQSIEEKIKTLQKQAKGMQQNLAQIVRTRYLMQDQNIVKLVLNQQDPEAVARSFIYYKNVAKAGDEFLTHVKQQEKELHDLTSELDQKQRQISSQLVELKKQEQEISRKNQQRQERLSQIKSSLQKDNKKVSLYENRQAELRVLLNQLRRDAQEKKRAQQAAQRAAELARQQARERASQAAKNQANQETTESNSKEPQQVADSPMIRRLPGNFLGAKGQMPLPVNGRVIQRFGDKDAESGVSQTGVMIEAQEGQPVRAIHGGQVVYADWFRGFGQLLVIDHGQGYMSLYGHNQVLLAQIGDVVDAGQQVARAGVTGGLTNPGLYFEIRVQGQPEDPLRWCKA